MSTGAVAKVDGDGRLISALLDEDVRVAKEDMSLSASLADVVAQPEVISHLARAGAKPLVSITSKVGSTGETEELRWVINSKEENRCSWKIPAKRLYSAAPRGVYIGGDHRWDEFSFLPGEFLTEWRNSADVNVSFYKTKQGTEKFTADEVKEWGVFNFVVRFGLSLSEDIDKATVLVLAMPVSEAGLRDLPGYELPGINYPHVCLDSQKVALGPLINRRTGLPLRVFVHHVLEAEPGWEAKEILESVRDMMANPNHTSTPSLEDWHKLVGGPEAPDMPDHRQAYSWPPLPEEELEDDGMSCHFQFY